jgi:hypothetical protein
MDTKEDMTTEGDTKFAFVSFVSFVSFVLAQPPFLFNQNGGG